MVEQQRALVDLVRDAFKNARANGYTFANHTDEEVALDMLAYDADIEERDPTVSELAEVIGKLRAEGVSNG